MSGSGRDSVLQEPSWKGSFSDDESIVCSSRGPFRPSHVDSSPIGHHSMDPSAVSLLARELN